MKVKMGSNVRPDITNKRESDNDDDNDFVNQFSLAINNHGENLPVNVQSINTNQG